MFVFEVLREFETKVEMVGLTCFDIGFCVEKTRERVEEGDEKGGMESRGG